MLHELYENMHELPSGLTGHFFCVQALWILISWHNILTTCPITIKLQHRSRWEFILLKFYGYFLHRVACISYGSMICQLRLILFDDIWTQYHGDIEHYILQHVRWSLSLMKCLSIKGSDYMVDAVVLHPYVLFLMEACGFSQRNTHHCYFWVIPWQNLT